MWTPSHVTHASNCGFDCIALSGAVLNGGGKSFCLEMAAGSALTTVAMPLSNAPTTLFDSLAGYPPWFVAACVTVVAVVLIWVAAKILKWSLYLLMALVLIGGAVATAWFVFK